jgi:hypothetical protein
MNMPPPPQLPPFQPTEPLDVTLEAQEWNVVFAALNECALPMRVARPVFDKIMGQVTRGTDRVAVESNVSH